MAFHAYRNASKTLSAASIVSINHDTERYDIGSNFNTATGIFTAPVPGLYHFDSSINTEATGNTRAFIQYTCSTAGAYRINDITGTTVRRVSGSLTIDLALNETVECKGFTQSATNVASPETFFTGYLVTRT